MTNFCSGITDLPLATQLKAVDFSTSYNNVNTIACFENKFKGLLNLESIYLGLEYNKIPSVAAFKNEFHNLKNMVSLNINVVNNPVSDFGL
mmetsp:Transcript_13761/g.1239  ORF Transcript_13761/g.1239 Transcript_13761/m.1239 type:complete len:91 (+) Transcript_13761:484-756(+)